MPSDGYKVTAAVWREYRPQSRARIVLATPRQTRNEQTQVPACMAGSRHWRHHPTVTSFPTNYVQDRKNAALMSGFPGHEVQGAADCLSLRRNTRRYASENRLACVIL
jgi:hypothetical protein